MRASDDRLRPVLHEVLEYVGTLLPRLRPLAKPLALIVIAVAALGALGFSGWIAISTLMRPSQTAQAAAAPAQAAAPVAKVADAPFLPPPNPGRTTSIVLEPNPARSTSARPAPARAASPPATPSLPVIELQSVAPPVSETPPSAEAVASPAAAVTPKSPIAPPPAAIYSSADTDVSPPRLTYPRYVEAMEHEHPNATPFQIVIDERGLVESAFLANNPRDMREAVLGTMLLAAAKAWRFQPATKDGQPVKYRRIVWFSN